MAKQSALNTKNVQKLKEKAKSATEKRLKQARKAQLRAIKQVEKDERYLIKLSANRRVLKTAHSISDIKLVGRPDAISFSPRSDASSFMSSASVSSSLASRISQSSSISNLLMIQRHRINLDLLGSRQWRKQPVKSSRVQLSTSSSDKDESAYSSSSMSTTSGYTCSNSNRSLFGVSSKAASKQKQSLQAPDCDNAHFRPKYSELVALGRDQSLAGPVEGKQSSLKSNSTISAKALKGISGVSRKMHLKRLSQLGDYYKASSANMTKTDLKVSLDNLSVASWRDKTIADEAQGGSSGRLCNVQPAIKLKLNPREAKSKAFIDDQGSFTNDASSIRWPPVPSLCRTSSEPNFGVAIREACESDQAIGEPDLKQNATDRDKPISTDRGSSTRPACAGEQRQLLTECLSQLKMHQHRSTSSQLSIDKSAYISGKTKTGTKENSIQKLAPSCNGASVSKLISHSDELLQHQMNAGKLPLKPSIIKQHQQQHLSRQLPLASEQAGRCTNDSIGSAGSLAQRSSQASSGSDKSTCDSSSMMSPPCSPDYASSASSSFEPIYAGKVVEVSKSSAKVALAAPAISAPLVAGPRETRAKMAPPKAIGGQLWTPKDIETFLGTHGLSDLVEIFAKERIDLDALMLLSEDDLKSLNVLLGPRRKLLKAIEERRARLATSAQVNMLVSVVDTPL